MTRTNLLGLAVVLAIVAAPVAALAAEDDFTNVSEQRRGGGQYLDLDKKKNGAPAPKPLPPPIPVKPIPNHQPLGGKGSSLDPSGGGAIPLGSAAPMMSHKDNVERALKDAAKRLR